MVQIIIIVATFIARCSDERGSIRVNGIIQGNGCWCWREIIPILDDHGFIQPTHLYILL